MNLRFLSPLFALLLLAGPVAADEILLPRVESGAIAIDGDLSEWEAVAPLFAASEGGLGPVRMAHDGRDLFIALSCRPEASRFGGAALYLDLDDDPETGHESPFDPIGGTDLRIGIGARIDGGLLLSGYDVDSILEDGDTSFYGKVRGGKQRSTTSDRVAHSAGGIELRLALADLGLPVGRSIGVILHDRVVIFRDRAFSRTRIAIDALAEPSPEEAAAAARETEARRFALRLLALAAEGRTDDLAACAHDGASGQLLSWMSVDNAGPTSVRYLDEVRPGCHRVVLQTIVRSEGGNAVHEHAIHVTCDDGQWRYSTGPSAPQRPGQRRWGPEQAAGAPDTLAAGDYPTAWASSAASAGDEWLLLEYERAVAIAEVRIHENLNPGAIARVVAIDEQGAEVVLWQGTQELAPALRTTVVTGDGATVARRVRVELDTRRTSGWSEIDAVELVGADGSRQWAVRATASSFYGQ